MVGAAVQRREGPEDTGTSSCVAVAVMQPLASVRRPRMDFWDGIEPVLMMPSISAEGAAHSRLRALGTASAPWPRGRWKVRVGGHRA